jgi:hypothetical protein
MLFKTKDPLPTLVIIVLIWLSWRLGMELYVF